MANRSAGIRNQNWPWLDHNLTRVLLLIIAVVSGIASGCFLYERNLGPISELFERNDCSPGMVVSSGESCYYPASNYQFRVSTAGASVLGSTGIQLQNIKVDYNSDQYAFQARRLENSTSWLIEVAGKWVDAGDPRTGLCEVGVIVRPGEYCHDPATGAAFRVYATDQEHIGDQKRSPYPEGYGVLLYWLSEKKPSEGPPLLADDEVYHGGFRAVRLQERTKDCARCWKIVSVGEPPQPAQAAAPQQSQEGARAQADGSAPKSEGPRMLAEAQAPEPCGLRPSVAGNPDPPSHNTVRDALVVLLFCTEDPDRATFHDLGEAGGDFGSSAPDGSTGCDFHGGHSGWHVQTKTAAREARADETFYSLTKGRVVRVSVERGGETESSFIAVWDETADRTTIYKRARKIFVHEGQDVLVGDALGIQGGYPMLDETENELVHIEVHAGLKSEPACGAGDDGILDPLSDSYLYDSVTANR